MSLDGLRAWIGEVERKLGMRTRVFLALTVIAIGISGAAIYLAIDARDNSVSKDDVQALQEQFEAGAGAAGVSPAGSDVVRLEAELKALQTEVAALKAEGGTSPKGQEKDGGAAGSGTRDGSSSEPREGSSNGTANGATGGAASAAKLQELLEQARDASEEAE